MFPGLPQVGALLTSGQVWYPCCSLSLWQGLAPWGRGGGCPGKGHGKWLLGLEGACPVGDLGAFGSSKAPS